MRQLDQLAVRRPERPRHHQPAGRAQLRTSPPRRSRSKTSSGRRRPAHRRAGHRSRHRPAGRRSPACWSKARTTSSTSPACPSSTGRRSPPISKSRATTSTTSASATIRSSASRRCWSSTRSSSSACEPAAGVEWDLNLDYLSERGLGFGTGVEYARDSVLRPRRPDHRPRRRLVHQRQRPRQPRPRPPRHRARRRIPRPRVLEPSPAPRRRAARRLDRAGRSRLAQRPHVPRSSTTKTNGTTTRTSSPACGSSARSTTNRSRSKPTAASTTSSRKRSGCRGSTTTGSASRWSDDQLTWFEHSSAAYANIGIASTPTNPTLLPQFELLPWEEDAAGNPITRRGRAVRHAAGDRLAARPRAVQSRAVRARRAGPLGRGHQRRRPPAGVRPHRRAGQHSVLGRRPDDPRPAVQPQRPRAQSRVRRRSLVRRRHAQTSTSSRSTTSSTTTRSRSSAAGCSSRRSAASCAGRYYIPGAPSFIDPKFDPRFYALRSGLQGWVTSPSTEIADDLAAVRLGMRHRLQTKRGPLGEERIVDWITFDSNATWFPTKTATTSAPTSA